MKKNIPIILPLVSPAAMFFGVGTLGRGKTLTALVFGLLWLLLTGSNALAMEPPICPSVLRQVALYRISSEVESVPKPEFSRMGLLDLRDSKSSLSIRSYSLENSESHYVPDKYGFIFLYKRCPGIKDQDTLSISMDCRTGTYKGKRVVLPLKFMKASLASMRPEFRKEIAKDGNCKTILETGTGASDSLQTLTLFYPNGKKMETFGYYLRKGSTTGKSDTIRSGPRIIWDSLGNKAFLLNYRAGKLHGQSLDWFKSGNVRVSSWHSNGIFDSSSYWDDKGKLQSRHHHSGENDTLFDYDEDGNMKTTIGLPSLD